MSVLLAIGPHVFESLPLSLQKITEKTKADWPANKRFGKGPARQFTGRGEDEFEVEGLYWDADWGGHDDYLALKATQLSGDPVELIGWAAGSGAAQIFGTVVILEVGATHEKLLGNGLGTKTEFSVKMAPFGGDDAFGGLF
jgi:uncharacterized protein